MPVIAIPYIALLLFVMLVQTGHAKRRNRAVRAARERYADPEYLADVRRGSVRRQSR